MFTYRYQQPDEYRFSLDSIHFAEYLAAHLKTRRDLSEWQVLDLCAGCGVIGLELSFYLRELRNIHFVEVQEIYQSYFEQNVLTVNRPELNLHFHLLNYDALLSKQWENQFDLIVSNPPYFQPAHGMLSPSTFKNRCRFFLDSSFEHFILSLLNALKPQGEAYFLLRSLKQHKMDLLMDIKNILKIQAKIERITTIRSAEVIWMKKV